MFTLKGEVEPAMPNCTHYIWRERKRLRNYDIKFHYELIAETLHHF